MEDQEIHEEFQEMDDGEIRRRVVKKTTYELDEVSLRYVSRIKTFVRLI